MTRGEALMKPQTRPFTPLLLTQPFASFSEVLRPLDPFRLKSLQIHVGTKKPHLKNLRDTRDHGLGRCGPPPW